jgi:hypothetical protein
MKILRLKDKSMQETTVITNQTSTTYTPQIFRQLKSLKFRKRRRRKFSEDWDLITPHKKESTVQGPHMLNKDKSIRCFGRNLQPTAMISLSPSRQRLCLQSKSNSIMKAILTGWHNRRIFKRERWQNWTQFHPLNLLKFLDKIIVKMNKFKWIKSIWLWKNFRRSNRTSWWSRHFSERYKRSLMN